MFDKSKKRLLALDGGGILGVISLGALRKIELDLRTHTGKPDLRLRDFFDYIAGTSTGGIIAAGLALGKTVDEIEAIYVNDGADIFEKRGWIPQVIEGMRRKFNHNKLTQRLKEEFTDATIEELQASGRLSTDRHLLIVTRNLETDSPWPISTNPSAKYNDPNRSDCNLRIPLWQLVRASTAAPTYFAPEYLQWDPNDPDKKFYFEDGGVTPYNNPSTILFRMATAPEYRCEWQTGEDKMMIISVGTSYSFRILDNPSAYGETLLTSARTLPSELMRGISTENDLACRTLGRCVAGHVLDSELGDMMPPVNKKTKRLFSYARFDIDVSAEALATEGLTDINTESLTLANVAAIPAMQKIGEKLGNRVNMKNQFGGFLT